jgi:hypothetical protein
MITYELVVVVLGVVVVEVLDVVVVEVLDVVTEGTAL